MRVLAIQTLAAVWPAMEVPVIPNHKRCGSSDAGRAMRALEFCASKCESGLTIVPKIGEEFAGHEKLGMAPKVLQNLWVSAEPFFNRLFTMRNILQNLPSEPPRVPLNSGEPLGARTRLLRTGVFPSTKHSKLEARVLLDQPCESSGMHLLVVSFSPHPPSSKSNHACFHTHLLRPIVFHAKGHLASLISWKCSASQKGVFGKKGLFKDVHFWRS